MHACFLEVEAAKKHYVESQREFFRANDEHDEVEKLIEKLEEEDASTTSSRESRIVCVSLSCSFEVLMFSQVQVLQDN